MRESRTRKNKQSQDLFNDKDVFRVLQEVLSSDLTIYYGPFHNIKDFKMPSVTVSYDGSWPNHIDVNVWADTEGEVCHASKLVLTTLNCMKKAGVTVYNVAPLNFEADKILAHFFDDSELQRLKQKALEEGQKSKYKYTKADADYARYIIRKSFMLSGYEQDMIVKALRKNR